MRGGWHQHQTLVLLLATIAVLEIVHGIEEIALLPELLTETQGAGAKTVGVTLTAYLAADILVRLPAGWLADHWERRGMIVVGLLLSLLPLPLMMALPDPLTMLLLNGVLGVGAGCIWPSVYAAIADRYGPETRGRILGLLNMAMLAGLGSGPIIGNLVVGAAGIRATFILCILLIGLVLAAVALGMGEERHQASAVDDPHAVSLLAGLRAIFSGELLHLGLISCAMTFGVALLLPIINLFGSEVLGLPLIHYALVLAIPGLVTATALIPLGRLADRYGRRWPLIGGLTLLALPFALAPISTHPAIVALGASVAGLGYAAAVPAWNALAMDRIPSASRGVLLGGIAALQGVGLMLGPTVGGWLWEQGVYLPFHLAALSFAAGLGMAWFVREAPTPEAVRVG